MQDVDVKHGGCPGQDKISHLGCSPLIDIIQRDSTKAFTRCPVCGKPAVFGSGDPSEDFLYYWCENDDCPIQIIHVPLYPGQGELPRPTKPIADIIDADLANESLRIAALLRSRP